MILISIGVIEDILVYQENFGYILLNLYVEEGIKEEYFNFVFK